MVDSVSPYFLCIDLHPYLPMSSYNIPLVADIHFAPSVALRVAECFDKIRVNPGNFGMHIFINSLVFFFLLYFLYVFLVLKIVLNSVSNMVVFRS